MAQFADHIRQVERNLKFLESINSTTKDCYDWQVTVCFYTSLHLVNAHLSKHNMQFRTHNDVNFALNFTRELSPAKMPEDEYIAYTSLQTLSRRSRYLVNEKDSQIGSPQAFFTYEKHVAKAIRHLDCLLSYFKKLYSIELSNINISCMEIKRKEDLKQITLTSSH
jgi:hypothetical protein